jgi:peptidoglycan pentaglycine glycine transferase (the first glycine)
MKISEITDKKIWENFITDNSPQSFFQSWNWGEISVSHATIKSENTLLRIGLYEDDILTAIAQVVYIKAKRGTFLHVRHGPVIISWRETSFKYLLEYLISLAKKRKVDFIRISPLIEKNIQNENFLKKYDFRNSPIHLMDGEYTWVLDTEGKSEDELLKDMRKTTRYLIRKAQNMGVVIKKSTDNKDLVQFMDLYHETAKRHRFVEHKGIKEEFEILLKDNQILLFNGYFEDRLLSTAMIVFYNHQAIYHHSASIDQKIPVSYLLQWEAIKEAMRRKNKVYNFWGIAPEDKPNHPWKGLSLFKQGFGGRKIEYLHAHDLPLTKKYYLTIILDNYRKWRKGY